MTNLDSILKKQRHYFADKGLYCQSCGFPSSHAWMWELDHDKGRTRKNWCFWTVLLEKNLKSPLDCKEIQPVHPKGNQSWILTGMTDAEPETPILWPPDVKSQLIGKDPDAGKDWGQEEKGSTDGWIASLSQWTWVWAKSRRWWRTRKPGELQFMRSQNQTWLSDFTTTTKETNKYSSHTLCYMYVYVQFSSIQSLSRVQLFAYLCLFIYMSTYTCHITEFSQPLYEGGLYFPYTGKKIETKFKRFVEGNRDYKTCLARHTVK